MTTPPNAHDAARPLAVTLSLHQDLFDRYGPLVGGRELCRLLGFPTLGASRQAALRGAADTERRISMT